LVYAGAVMMLVVFVIMVLNQAKEHTIPIFDWFSLTALALPVVLGAALVTTALSAAKPTFVRDDKAGLIERPQADQSTANVHFAAVDAGEGATYAWDFGDQNVSTSREVRHEYAASTGIHTAKLTIGGSKNHNGSASVTFRAVAVPRGEIALLSAAMFDVRTQSSGFYILFELIGVVLLAAVVGAVVLAKRSLESRPPAEAAHEAAHEEKGHH
jgi:NADH:ubiquinone oxidoreductase subunit 6 (subunit J)